MKTVYAIILLLSASLASAASHSQLESIRALRSAGNYQQALDLGRAALLADANNAPLLNELGELEFATGKPDAARARFLQVIDLAGSERLMAMLNLAEIHRQRGDLPAAERLYHEIRAAYQTQPGLSARDLYAIASATRELGRADPQLYKEAVQLFDQASRMDPSFAAAGIALGELLLEKYNNQEALEVFNEVLAIYPKHPQALLGLARSQHFDYSSAALQTALQVLELNPNLAAARVFMARLYLELEQYRDAKFEVQQALALNPLSLEALSMLAVANYLERNQAEFAALEQRVLALNPHYADFYTVLADMAAQNRLYREAQAFAAAAIKLDPM
jgi:tetratricopeptide (TPR) repeat protein